MHFERPRVCARISDGAQIGGKREREMSSWVSNLCKISIRASSTQFILFRKSLGARKSGFNAASNNCFLRQTPPCHVFVNVLAGGNYFSTASAQFNTQLAAYQNSLSP